MRIWKRSYFCIGLLAVALLFAAISVLCRVDVLPTIGKATSAKCIILDAGHGGEDGGAISCTGINESELNLQIARRLNDFLLAIGRPTKMLRTQDVSLHTGTCSTIAEKKRSDLKHRVQMVQETENALLVSIHQNQFPESKYHGAQVFYAASDGSEALAECLQSALCTGLDPSNRRQIKPADKVYLLSKVTCPAVLVECGFLSNPDEEARLRSDDYQKRLAAVIGCAIEEYLRGNEMT